MTRKAFLIAISLLVSGTTSAQSWIDMGPFPDSTTFWRSSHGVAVDAEGKVWVSQYFPEFWVLANGDTLKDRNGEYISTPAVHIFNSDGTKAMEPIRSFTYRGMADTLFWDVKDGPAKDVRGIRTDHNGNIIIMVGTPFTPNNPLTRENPTSLMFRLDHQTGEVLDRVDLGAEEFGSPASPGIDANGNIYIAPVAGSSPIKVYDSDFQDKEIVTTSAPGIGRTVEVTADGNTVYWSAFTHSGTYKYQRPNEFAPYDSIGLIHEGLLAESSARDPSTGYIWLGHSVAGSIPLPSVGRFAPGSELTWFAIDPATDEIVDSLNFDWPFVFGEQKTRGIGFSPDGNYAYVGLFDNSRDGDGIPLNGVGGVPRGFTFKKFMRGQVTNIQRDPVEIPDGFTLSQNYPNPFNPQTNIEFEIKDAGLATLKVYDVLGREVATLVDEHLITGKYTATFNATDLSSGTYVYQLNVAGHLLSGRMTLVK
ncbi:MAG: T9SS type A sorting domain-containing protein [Bacteroidetes bacterium]|nr:T9SS type A sorting domain-containing protein [Bacteroidota bacterium]MCY4204433.1 T9SS type A sorting domain-containing protein [Bacteroidota bacterium]